MLSVEYFGGVLASSRSGNTRDDRGAFFISLISRLSNYQLRLHYLLYQAIKINFNGESINFGIDQERPKLRLFIPFDTFKTLMAFSEEEEENSEILLDHSINGLIKEDLIDNWFQTGTIEYLKKAFPDVNDEGIILQPSRLGIELFYWAFGKGQENPRGFLLESVNFDNVEAILIDNTVKRVNR